MNEVLKFDDFLNEELNVTRYDNGVCRLSDRWFYYNQDDDIIYGCDEKPVGDDVMFAFNPTSCTILLNGEEKQYDVNNPICLIQYIMEDGKVIFYTDGALEILRSTFGFTSSDITSQQSRFKLQDAFERSDDYRYILLYGDQFIASTFDVIEEN
jgi:hypothetical protein